MIRPDFPYIPVPHLFYPFDSKAPFSRCSACEAELIRSEREYMIEKALKPNDSIYEYAICFDCIKRSRERISTESMQSIEDFFVRRACLAKHRDDMLRKFDLNYHFWLNHCVVHGTPVSELYTYQILAHCQGPYMLFSVFPYCLGEAAADELADMLSARTLGELDDLGNELIRIPPELRELWRRKPVLI